MARILVCDDDASVRRGLTRLLESLGHTVVAHDDAIHALQELKKGERFDMIVSDNAMPRMNGTELLEEIRLALGLESLPFILITGELTEDVKDQCRILSAECFEKPLDVQWLKERISKLAM